MSIPISINQKYPLSSCSGNAATSKIPSSNSNIDVNVNHGNSSGAAGFCSPSQVPKQSSFSKSHIINPKQSNPKRRASSFTSSSSPWARRKSFLSQSMISNDKSSIYELSSSSMYYFNSSSSPSSFGSSYSSSQSPCESSSTNPLSMTNSTHQQRIPSFSMCLRESQGFIFNQDLFASQYQQSRAIMQDDNQGIILKDLRNTNNNSNSYGSIFGNSARRLATDHGEGDEEDYGIEVTEVVVDDDDEVYGIFGELA
ncbi:hypothetical protein PACTADRAFT_50074 [Pachysolen tannophilus NRRL Y-2460]|uniref:Uncharacterized protein n=1 Tax=Pachysolen tannophilus NRRL Y-2460 TaxID=669874 RepID=A0A1E4TUB8_PACTA|nr:hypothetical protein PACTADRAFT_50074 [Pachysolen tannophilus NRRL Y-2460]